MSQPLVSIAIPCYNAGTLLSRALASVLAQSYEEWECIVVDDGSADGVGEIVSAAEDARIRLLRHSTNRGRAAARQSSLDASQGVYLAKLDADDWLYPDKLARQVVILEQHPDIALVSSAIGIMDAQGALLGVHARGESDQCVAQPPLSTVQSPPVAHAPSMIRMSIAKQYQYDASLERSEDADFLLKILLNNPYCVMNSVTYAYSEYRSANRAEILSAYRWRMRMFWRYRRSYPAASLQRTAESALKWTAYYGAFSTGMQTRLLSNRSEPPTAEDFAGYAEARQTVSALLEQTFPVHLRPDHQRSEVVYD